MDKETRAYWPKDFATELPMVPPGEFTTFKEYPHSTQPARIRKLPVLRGWFDSKRFDANPNLPAHVGWGSVNLGNATTLTFRIQLGPNVLYWLANPGDPHVWEVIDKWAAAKRMVLAAEFPDAPPLLIGRDFDLRHPGLQVHRKALNDATYTKRFIAEASQVIVTDDMRHIASSDIAAFPKLEHVQACLVRTRHTEGVAVLVNEGAPSADGAVADAVKAMVNAMLQPEKLRH